MTKYCYDYPRPALTSDIVVFSYNNNRLLVLLIQRKYVPFKGKWALPGGFVDMEETAEECAYRELHEETGIEIKNLSQLVTASALGRDPRGRTVSVFFYGFIGYDIANIKAGDDAKNAQWFQADKLPSLAFDHNDIILIALKKLKELIQLGSFGHDLLPQYFKLPDLQQLFYIILSDKEITEKYIKQYIESGFIRENEDKSGLYSFA
ncbi:MAG: NUDIX hydrolase [Bacteroidales bacterium]|nr:MAG: NUDIX hydrolase [Bacteroidales bacterium]